MLKRKLNQQKDNLEDVESEKASVYWDESRTQWNGSDWGKCVL